MLNNFQPITFLAQSSCCFFWRFLSPAKIYWPERQLCVTVNEFSCVLRKFMHTQIEGERNAFGPKMLSIPAHHGTGDNF